MDFSNWSKQDFIDFDARRIQVFTPTPEEIAEQEAQEEARRLQKVQFVLSKVGLALPENVDKIFVLDFCERVDARQFVGDVETFIDTQYAEFQDYKKGLITLINQYF